MNGLRAWLKMAIAAVAFALVPAAFLRAFWIDPVLSLSIAGFAFALIILFLGTTSESVITKNLGAKHPENLGLKITLDRIERIVRCQYGHGSKPLPSVWVFPEPYAYIVLCRSLWSPGRLLISQGAINSLTEKQLRQVIQKSFLEVIEPQIVVQSICSVALRGVLKMCPAAWVKTYCQIENRTELRQSSSLGPAQTLQFMFFYPAIRLIQWAGDLNSSPSQRVDPRWLIPGYDQLYKWI